MHRQQYQPQQTTSHQAAPNASIATMAPTTYQNSPYNQHGFQMSQQPQQYQPQQHQQQEQHWVQQVRQELQGGSNQGQQVHNASIATMDPTTYQNSPYNQYGFQMSQQQQHQQQHQQPQQYHQQEQQWLQQVRQELSGSQPQGQHIHYGSGPQTQNASLATMSPTTYQNSPYVRQHSNPGQPIWQQSGNLNASLATMSPTTYENSPYVRQQSNPGQAMWQQSGSPATYHNSPQQ